MIAAAAAAATCTNDAIDASEDSPYADVGELKERERVSMLRLRLRLKKTLQQVAVHRVQQIYACLNGSSVLESSGEEIKTLRNKPRSVERGGMIPEKGTEEGEEGLEDEQQRLEREARELVSLAFSLVRSSDACRSDGMEAAWIGGCGDDNRGDLDPGGGGEGPSLRAMAPYMPVWVGFASSEEVKLSHVSYCLLQE